MNLLVTAGNTHAPIDRVRVITNVFSGRTGAAIARAAVGRGHRATLLTSHPETIPETVGGLCFPFPSPRNGFRPVQNCIFDSVILSL